MSDEEEYAPRASRARSRRTKGVQPTGFRAWTSAALGALVLVSAGFLLGIALGVVSEEPEMVASHLIGQSEEVLWGAQALGEVSAPPDLSSVRPLALQVPPPALPEDVESDDVQSEKVIPEVPPQPKPSELRPQAHVAAVSAAPAPVSAGWAVQVGAFASSSSADALAQSLQAKGFAAYLTPSSGPSEGRWRVRVGPLATQNEARRLAQRLERE